MSRLLERFHQSHQLHYITFTCITAALHLRNLGSHKKFVEKIRYITAILCGEV
jgi:hypothetical protein